MHYSTEEREIMRDMRYQDEMKFLKEHGGRTAFIAGALSKTTGNILALSRNLQHLKDVRDALKKLGRESIILNGSTKKEIRAATKAKIEESNDLIVLSTFNLMSTGINIKKIHCVAFILPVKSSIWVRQAIGRGLRIHASKKELKILDFIDYVSFDTGITGRKFKEVKQKTALIHAHSRREIYDEDGFPVIYTNVKISKAS